MYESEMIIGQETVKQRNLDVRCATCGKVHRIFGLCSPQVELDGVVESTATVEKEEVQMTDEQVLAEVAKLQAELEALKGAPQTVAKKEEGVKKNQKPGKPSATRKYVLLTKSLAAWGKVPQQQADIAKILGVSMEVGKEYTEGEVFDLVSKKAVGFASLAKSRQDPTYLLRYYRGLKNDGKHAGLIARNFLRVV